MTAAGTAIDSSLSANADELRQLVEEYLESLSFSEEAMVAGLQEAMRYALLAGGKRVRPLLALGTAQALSVEPERVFPFAAALEMIHTYSLIHDDLPAMDDDDLRRGRPTCHKQFGEGVAILAGDGLYAEAFSHLVSFQKGKPEDVLAAVRELASATGTQGMVGGQYADVVGEGSPGADPNWIKQLHELKTGRLIRVSVEGVVILAGERSHHLLPGFRTFATELGLLFQIVDDILDVTGTDSALGKPSGSDVRNEKLTYVSIYGLDRARELAAESHQRSLDALTTLQQQNTVDAGDSRKEAGNWELLAELTNLIYSRSS